MYGWGYDTIDAPNVDQLHAMGNIAAEAMQNKNDGSSYSVGNSAMLLYRASGWLRCIISVNCKYYPLMLY